MIEQTDDGGSVYVSWRDKPEAVDEVVDRDVYCLIQGGMSQEAGRGKIL